MSSSGACPMVRTQTLIALCMAGVRGVLGMARGVRGVMLAGVRGVRDMLLAGVRGVRDISFAW